MLSTPSCSPEISKTVQHQILQLFEMKQIEECALVVLEVIKVLNAKTFVKTLQNIIQSEEMMDVSLGKAITKDVILAGEKFKNWTKFGAKGKIFFTLEVMRSKLGFPAQFFLITRFGGNFNFGPFHF